MTIIAVQCRLASTRLPNKALLLLDNVELIRWTLRTLKKVHADEYWVACDEKSYSVLSKIATDEGWNCFFGPENDVLERYCLLAKKTGADIILRATADNPFLFYEAAMQSIIEFEQNNYDYFAFSGLPHGSGVEVFSAKALLRARDLTNNSYDHEHVGPALYNHTDVFNAVFKPSPLEWTHESDGLAYRTTVDTTEDYKKALRIVSFLKCKGCIPPYSTRDIFLAIRSVEVNTPIVFIPTVQKGRGTGHIRRTIKLIDLLQKNCGLCPGVYLDEPVSNEAKSIIQSAYSEGIFNESSVVKQIESDSSLIIDTFNISKELSEKLHSSAPIISIDEGGEYTDCVDYTLNVIPSLIENKNVNAFQPELLDLPLPVKRKITEIKKILVSIGGEDPANFTDAIITSLHTLYKNTDVIIDSTKDKNIDNLQEHIHEYDLVITHYGLTAFEACNAGCALITVATSPLHKKLSKKYNLVCLGKNNCSPKYLSKVLSKHNLFPTELRSLITRKPSKSLDASIARLIQSSKYNCPVCNNGTITNPVVARDIIKTIRHCALCGLHYISFCAQDDKEYSESYFFDEYKNQYGKTYLEDFDAIKKQGVRRCNTILLSKKNMPQNALLLDVGCAYGPFLSAAKDFGFIPFGSDISTDAVNYVQNTLHFTAKEANFASKFTASEVFSSKMPSNGQFDVITMWFVIEHFQNLDIVLRNVSINLKNGGVFAFSTPNALGVSRRVNKKSFFLQSPYDHFSIWDARSASNVLKKYGFKIQKIAITGVHKNRFPKVLTLLPYCLFTFLVQSFKLGDTFEVYCIKEKDIT